MGKASRRGERVWVAAIALASLAVACPARAEPSLVESLLAAQPSKFAALLAAPSTYRLQVLFTEIDGRDGTTTVHRHGFRADAEYFYPASSIKLCAAVAALEKLAEVRAKEQATDLARTTPARFFALDERELPAVSDATNADGGRATVSHEIQKALIGSDNEAFNRLYAFVGHRELNERMWEHGLASVRIASRIGYLAAPEEARITPRVDFLLPDARTITVPKRTSTLAFEEETIAGLLVGARYLENGRMVARPMSFATKTRISLRDLHELLIAVARPDLVSAKARPKIDPSDRDFLLQTLATLPRESKNPIYDPALYPDAAQRPILPGVLAALPRERLEVLGKSGRAYGFTIENAYVADRVTHTAFFVTAAIYTNADEVLNDDLYEYGTASSYLADLGEALARYAFRERPATAAR